MEQFIDACNAVLDRIRETETALASLPADDDSRAEVKAALSAARYHLLQARSVIKTAQAVRNGDFARGAEREAQALRDPHKRRKS